MSLTLISGSMFSGKTTMLIDKVATLRELGMKCLVVNHVTDSRVCGEFVETHDSISIPAVKSDSLLTVSTIGYDAVAIDEAQFFTNLKLAVLNMVEKKGQHVIVAGLSGDYLRRPFGELLELVPYADTVVWTRAMCGICATVKASFTLRLSEETQKVSVDSTYVPTCRGCYMNRMSTRPNGKSTI